MKTRIAEINCTKEVCVFIKNVHNNDFLDVTPIMCLNCRHAEVKTGFVNKVKERY